MDASGREGDKIVLEQAAALRAPLARAARLGRANSVGYALFGALTLALGGLADVPTALLGACLLAVGLRGHRGAARLAAGDASAPPSLARNEGVLLLAIVAYSVFQLTVPHESSDAELEMLAEAAGVDLSGLVEAVRGVVYGGVIAASLAYQGGMALYFRRRRPLAERYERDVPSWARDILAKL